MEYRSVRQTKLITKVQNPCPLFEFVFAASANFSARFPNCYLTNKGKTSGKKNKGLAIRYFYGTVSDYKGNLYD